MSEILVSETYIREVPEMHQKRDPGLRLIEQARIDRRRAAERNQWRHAAWWFVTAIAIGLIVGLMWRNW